MSRATAFETNGGKNVDLTVALRWLNSAVVSSAGNKLREPELVILKGTWRGLTYEQMADDSEYSTNYLMRDVAPKLWKQLSNVFGRSVGKTNFRVALEAYAAANANVGVELSGREDVQNPLTTYYGGRSEAASMAARSSEDRYDFVSALRRRTGAMMYGYEDEMSRATGWLTQVAVENPVRVVGVWGLSGVGKTMLAERLLLAAAGPFDRVVGRSLFDRPKLGDLCVGILAELGVASEPTQAVSHLLAVMTQQSILLLLEDVEAIFQPGCLAGRYLPGYQNYEDFILSVAGVRSCVVLTGIERPAGLVYQGEQGDRDGGHWVQSLSLNGLDAAAATALLQQESLSAHPSSMAVWPELIECYQGHPLALKSAARVIRDIFNGRVDEFIAQMSVLFSDILRLLLPSFERLCATELNIVYWLAGQERSLSLAELTDTLPVALRSAEIVSALDSLKQRSLLLVQTHDDRASNALSRQSDSSSTLPTFDLPPLVKAYAVYRFVEQISEQAAPPGLAVQSSVRDSLGYQPIEPMIVLGSQARQLVCLSQWFEGQFDARWQPLAQLFSTVTCSARLRSTYRFRDETSIKRCMSVVLSVPKDSSKKSANVDSKTGAILLIAIHQDGENLYRICVQAQPLKTQRVLPERLQLRLLDTEEAVLAVVNAELSDSFIQLPYFQGARAEFFEIELALGRNRYREKFEI